MLAGCAYYTTEKITPAGPLAAPETGLAKAGSLK